MDKEEYKLFLVEITNGIVTESYPLSEIDEQREWLSTISSTQGQGTVELVVATPDELGMADPSDVPHFDVGEYEEQQIVGVQGDVGERNREKANANAKKWKKALKI